jgi:hypothetical protein
MARPFSGPAVAERLKAILKLRIWLEESDLAR